MSIFDLLFLASMLGVAIVVVRVLYLLIRSRWRAAGRAAAWLLMFVAAYMLVLAGFSIAEPRQEVAIGTPQCFDDWCITVETASRQDAIGTTRATGTFCIATVRVSSRAKGRPQRETDVRVYLLDDRGHRFDVSSAGRRALEQHGLAGLPLTSFVDAGGSFESRLAFDVPRDVGHLNLVKTSWGWFPFRLIIGDPQSWLHRPTVVPLPFPG
ncbi:MAG TPA: hypothetical protein VGQ65_21245 [Thermoanaerobaculia bacterium]|jgi:hypothetical protein|nr:hypothetical protein [Thermoanaerobaculia bacterium]